MLAKSINKFYISWRKCLRQLYLLPYRTHNNLLHLIFKDQPIDVQKLLHLLGRLMNPGPDVSGRPVGCAFSPYPGMWMAQKHNTGCSS